MIHGVSATNDWYTDSEQSKIPYIDYCASKRLTDTWNIASSNPVDNPHMLYPD